MASASEFDYQRAANNLRLIAYIGLAGDLVIAAVFVLLRPLANDIDYFIAAVMVASGIGMFVLVGWFLPKRYEIKAQAPQEIGMKKQGV